MKKFAFLLIVLVFLTIITLTIYTQDNNSNTSLQETQQIQTKSDNEKLDILETKVNIMNDYNSRILDNIYWALGAITTVIFIVLGLGYYNNKRNLDEQIQELKNSIRQDLLLEVNKISTEEIDKIKSHELRDLAKIKSDFSKMQYDFIEMEVKSWKTKEVYGNVFSTSVDLLKIAQESEHEFRILKALEYVKEAVKSGGLTSTSNTDYVQLLDLLNKLNDKFSIEVENMRELIKAKKAE